MKLINTALGLATSKLTGNPFYIRYQVTYRCNYACRMCGQRQIDLGTVKELPIAEIRQMAAKLAHLGARHVVLTGGEPFMRKDLPEIIAAFSEHNFSVRVQTNGGPQLSYKRLAECVTAGLNDLSVSIDTLNKPIQDDICQREGVVNHALQTLEYARELLPNGISQANIVASKFNFEELPSLVRFFHEKGIYIYITPVMIISEMDILEDGYQFRCQDESFEIDGLSSETHERVINELLQLRRDGFGLTNSSHFLRSYLTWLEQRDHSWKCEAGSISLDILPDGSVSVCKEKEPFGNLLDPGFEERFHSREYRQYARKVSATCSGCFYGEYREPQYVLRNNAVLWEWVRDWFRIFRFGMRYNRTSKPEGGKGLGISPENSQ